MNKYLKYTLITLAVIGSLIAIAYIALIVGTWPGSTKELKKTADSFIPDKSWKLESEDISPPRSVCLDGHCGMVRKVWHTDKNFFASCRDIEFFSQNKHVATSSSKGVSHDALHCKTVTNSKESISIEISYDEYSPDDYGTLILNVQEEDR